LLAASFVRRRNRRRSIQFSSLRNGQEMSAQSNSTLMAQLLDKTAPLPSRSQMAMVFREIKECANCREDELVLRAGHLLDCLFDVAEAAGAKACARAEVDIGRARFLIQCFGVAFYYSRMVRTRCWERVFEHITDFPVEIQQLLVYEMVFVESGLGREETDLREAIHRRIKEIVEQEATDVQGRPVSSLRPRILEMAAVQDYLASFESRKKYKQEIARLENRRRGVTSRIKVASFHSIKGGVGKTLLAHAVAHRLASGGGPESDAGRPARVALLDIDYSGPSAQYIVSLGRLTRFCQEFAGTAAGEMYGLNYPNFWSVFEQEFGDNHESTWRRHVEDVEKGKKRILDDATLAKLCYESEAQPNLEVILTTHDTVQLPEFQTYFAVTSRQARLVIFLDELITYLDQVRGITHLIIDSGPGLYGVQGLVMQYLSSSGMKPVVMSSNRVYDIFSTAYEMAWFLSREEFPTTPLWIVNMFERTEREDSVGEHHPFHPLKVMSARGLEADRGNGVTSAIDLLRDAWTYGRYLIPDEHSATISRNLYTYANRRLTVATVRWNQHIADLVNIYRTEAMPDWQGVFRKLGEENSGRNDCWLTDLDSLITALFSSSGGH